MALVSLLLLVTSLYNIVLCTQSHGIITRIPSDSPFDGGAVESCEVPILSSTEICSTTVTYPVPTSIARLANIVEESIHREVHSIGDQSCRTAYQAALCRLRFPRCEFGMVVLNAQDCNDVFNSCEAEERIRSNLVQVCNSLNRVTLPLTGCRPVSELGRNFSFQYCSVDENTVVTQWMFEYMKFAESKGAILYTVPVCGELFASYMCNFGGQCNDDGLRVQFTNTYESCHEAVTCFADDNQVIADEETPCHLWPSQSHSIDIDPKEIISDPVDMTISNTADHIIQDSASVVLGQWITVALGLLSFHTLFILL